MSLGHVSGLFSIASSSSSCRFIHLVYLCIFCIFVSCICNLLAAWGHCWLYAVVNAFCCATNKISAPFICRPVQSLSDLLTQLVCSFLNGFDYKHISCQLYIVSPPLTYITISIHILKLYLRVLLIKTLSRLTL